MGLRYRSIRMRVFLLVIVPILSLTGLYAFAVSITAHDALLMARSRTVKDTIGLPTGALQGQIGAERLLAVVYLASHTPQNLAALRAQERKTDAALRRARGAVTSAQAMSSSSPQEKRAVSALLREASGLSALRAQVTSLTISRAQALRAYSGIFAAADQVLNQLILEETNVPLAAQGLALVGMGRSEEMLLQEDALLTGDLAARSFSAADRQQFTELAGGRRNLAAQTLPLLDPVYRRYYSRDVSQRALASLTALEDSVISSPAPRAFPRVSPTAWSRTAGAVVLGLSQAGRQAADEATLRAQPVARATYLRLIVAGGAGLLAILVSVLFSILIGRGLIRQLARLRDSALELANDRLPGIVHRLRAGQEVDVAAEAPPMTSGNDEIGQVQQAFNEVRRTAIEAAVDEAKLRRGISEVFRNLARRSQSLLHRQLALLDGMERRASGPEELEDLFRIDHLTTRMRRHAEGLIILSGEAPGRGWRHPVPLVDVLRAAVAEVEDYTRIKVVSKTQAALAGPAVADVIHLIAELAENATIFSPPNTPVRILGDIVGRGFAVEIEDRGLGIAAGKLDEINQNLATPPQFDLSGSDRLGLFVAGQLASRHNIKITLRPSPYGGTTAIVLIPSELVVDESGSRQLAGAAGGLPIRLTGRHSARLQEGHDPLRTADRYAAAITGLPAGHHSTGEGSTADSTAADDSTADTITADGSFTGAEVTRGRPADSGTAVTQATRPPVGSTAPRAARPAGPAAWPADPAAGPAVADSPGAAATPAAWSSADEALPARPRPADTADDPPAAAAGPDPDHPAAGSAVSSSDPAGHGLPTRIRQASLVPQLRDSEPPARSTDNGAPPAPLSPEAARNTMAALQRGWERGRSVSAMAEPVGSADPDPEQVTGELTLNRADE